MDRLILFVFRVDGSNSKTFSLRFPLSVQKTVCGLPLLVIFYGCIIIVMFLFPLGKFMFNHLIMTLFDYLSPSFLPILDKAFLLFFG